jgi:hypothetical protein
MRLEAEYLAETPNLANTDRCEYWANIWTQLINYIGNLKIISESKKFALERVD